MTNHFPDHRTIESLVGTPTADPAESVSRRVESARCDCGRTYTGADAASRGRTHAGLAGHRVEATVQLDLVFDGTEAAST